MMMMKICSKCNISKTIDSFNKWKRSKDGHAPECRECKSHIQKRFYDKNKELCNIRTRRWQKENESCVKEKRREWKNKNREKVRASGRESYLRNKEERKNRLLERYQNDPDLLEKRRRYKREYEKAYKKASPIHKLKSAMRTRMWIALKGKTKNSSLITYLGCSIEELKKHLESRFQPGMSWENYNHKTWHIDHQIPLASFDLSKEDNLYKAWHFSNLYPMWAKDNLIKGSKNPANSKEDDDELIP